MKKRNLDNVDLIVIHCDASSLKKYDNIASIKKMHLKRGFDDVGYNWFITSEGIAQAGRSLHFIPAHCLGYNLKSFGICLHGLKIEDFTTKQFDTTARVIQQIKLNFPNNKFDIVSHRFLDKKGKTCPVFDMMEIFKRI